MPEGISGNRIERLAARGGAQALRLSHESGYSVVVSEHGAHVVSWVGPNERELLFMSEAARFEPGIPIRGGIPIVFPQFGEGVLPKHGFARTMEWKAIREQVSVSGPVTVTFRLLSDAQTLQLWPHRFQVELDVVLTDVLLLSLRVENTGDSRLEFNSALHTYFRTKDVAGVRVRGLEGSESVDFLKDRTIAIDPHPEIGISGPVDRVYRNSPQTVLVESAQDGIVYQITKEGFADTVIWNPWIDGARAISDFLAAEYREMVCVESGNILTTIALEPGELHASAQILRADFQRG